MLPLINGESKGTQEFRNGFREFPTERPRRTEDDVRIRGYLESDRPAIRRLCCDTGFLGNPIDAVFQDRESFADLFTSPYLDHEPNWALVAEAKGRVVGYLLGSVRSHFDFTLMRNGFPVASRMLWKLLAGRYAHHPRTKRFVRWVLTAGYLEQAK